jgi:hypothetical protein
VRLVLIEIFKHRERTEVNEIVGGDNVLHYSEHAPTRVVESCVEDPLMQIEYRLHAGRVRSGAGARRQSARAGAPAPPVEIPGVRRPYSSERMLSTIPPLDRRE